jgi:HlyD family secretion protein
LSKEASVRNKIIFVLAVVGLTVGLVSAYIFGIEKKPMPPAFSPASNPYAEGIYANGILESYQASGANVNIYPEVAGTIKQIFVAEGSSIKKGAPLVQIDNAIQRATVEQQRAQIELADANLKTTEDQLEKVKRSAELEPRSVSKSDMDNAVNAVKVARATIEVTRKQYELSQTVLSKYSIKAPTSGIILTINTAVGSYVSSQGSYDTYTQGYDPVLVMSSAETYMAVRCYIDEILISRLPPASQMRARMFVRGTNINIPLEYVRVQPYVSPKIQLSNQRTERVDVRVLPVIFRFRMPESKNVDLYPGQLVDVYIGDRMESKGAPTGQ